MPIHIRPTNLMAKAAMPAVLSDGALVLSFVEAAVPSGDAPLIRRRAFAIRLAHGSDTSASTRMARVGSV